MHTILLYSDYGNSSAGGAAFGISMLIFLVLILALVVLMVASNWKLFEKAGKPGWAAIVPIYNTITMLEIAGKPIYWIGLMMIPYIGIIWGIWTLNVFVKSFGKSSGYALGVIFLPFIFLPMMAFDKNTVYVGPGGVKDEVNDYLSGGQNTPQ
jgi:hypothetical protein